MECVITGQLSLAIGSQEDGAIIHVGGLSMVKQKHNIELCVLKYAQLNSGIPQLDDQFCTNLLLM